MSTQYIRHVAVPSSINGNWVCCQCYLYGSPMIFPPYLTPSWPFCCLFNIIIMQMFGCLGEWNGWNQITIGSVHVAFVCNVALNWSRGFGLAEITMVHGFVNGGLVKGALLHYSMETDRIESCSRVIMSGGCYWRKWWGRTRPCSFCWWKKTCIFLRWNMAIFVVNKQTNKKQPEVKRK